MHAKLLLSCVVAALATIASAMPAQSLADLGIPVSGAQLEVNNADNRTGESPQKWAEKSGPWPEFTYVKRQDRRRKRRLLSESIPQAKDSGQHVKARS
ncbi:hypothetical protein SARC_03745 [Sphaeroforma arctica JP610]|uniref:Uncharacterized protein n=1 Tax=Sphaeroforma arctica JP610 TaxID=667725 RepID=A0A0L0G4S0_9EUKA|nr:hypothetical protein SARC_03745 [Sphaeroforma arctica JP610]KNC84035.1 hypothetical protein SARC_03745 [Sphaeroforma arctica JP610]|eukprot:XP_014157937.1 hypothetical protein SARC_03745 [Sphaeroforma arctica JP610]